MRSTRILVASFLFGSVLTAQGIVVVDAAGGPGSHYLDLPQAVAAAPDGARVFVRPGSYRPFQVAGKALHIRGAGPALTKILLTGTTGIVSVGAVSSEKTFVLEEVQITVEFVYPAMSPAILAPHLDLTSGRFYLRNVHIKPSFNFLGYLWTAAPHGAGLVLVRNATLLAEGLVVSGGLIGSYSTPNPAALAADSSLLHLVGGSFVGPVTSAFAQDGGPGILLLKSTADLFQVYATGGVPCDFQGSAAAGADGGPGILVASGSLLLMDGGTVTGGDGWWSVMSGPEGVAGPGIEVQQGGAASLRGTVLQGGARPKPGPATRGSGLLELPAAPVERPRLCVSRASSSLESYALTLAGVPGRSHVILVSPGLGWIPLGPFGLVGTLLLDPLVPGFQVVGGVVLSAYGSWVLRIPAIPGVSIGPFWFQAVMLVGGDQTVSSTVGLFSTWPL